MCQYWRIFLPGPLLFASTSSRIGIVYVSLEGSSQNGSVWRKHIQHCELNWLRKQGICYLAPWSWFLQITSCCRAVNCPFEGRRLGNGVIPRALSIMLSSKPLVAERQLQTLYFLLALLRTSASAVIHNWYTHYWSQRLLSLSYLLKHAISLHIIHLYFCESHKFEIAFFVYNYLYLYFIPEFWFCLSSLVLHQGVIFKIFLFFSKYSFVLLSGIVVFCNVLWIVPKKYCFSSIHWHF